jgi:L-amino acid N-acyltransferase YncA
MTTAIIRLATIDDAEQIAAIYAPVVTDTPISFELDPPDTGETARRIVGTLERYPWLVCENAGEVLGYVYASRHRSRAAYQWSVDTAVYLHPRYRRSGIGRALYTTVFGVLPLQGFYNAYAGITLPNAASVGLHEALGFEPVGIYCRVGYKLGHWHDVGCWQRSLQTHTDPVCAPLSLDAVRNSDSFRDALAQGSLLLRI